MIDTGPPLARAALLALAALGRLAPLAAQDSAPAAREPDVVFVPTPIATVRGMLRLAAVGRSDLVYDLGSGDGRIVIAAAREFGARAVGIDIDPARIAESRANADTAGVAGRVSVRQGDLFRADLRPATVVTLYLTVPLNLRLRPKLLRELRPGARVVSNSFDMGEWTPDSTAIVRGFAQAETPVHLWIIPADARGEWRVTIAGDGRAAPETLVVRFTQRFQRLQGSAMVNRRRVALAEAKLRGDRVSFTLPGDGARPALRFEGRLAGGLMEGTVAREGAGETRPWRAVRTARRSSRRATARAARRAVGPYGWS